MIKAHPAASSHLPWFLTAPGDSDILFTITTIIVIGDSARSGSRIFPAALAARALRPQEAAVRDRRRAGPAVAVHARARSSGLWLCCWRSSICRTSRPRYADGGRRSRNRLARRTAASPRNPSQTGAAAPSREPRLMLELALCSSVHDPSRLSLPALLPGQAAGLRDHVVLDLVRAAMGHHAVPDADGRADHRHLLLPPVHDQRGAVVPHGCDPARDERARERDLRQLARRGREGRAASSSSTARNRKPTSSWRSGASSRSTQRWSWRRPTSRRGRSRSSRPKGAQQQAQDELDTKAGAEAAQ